MNLTLIFVDPDDVFDAPTDLVVHDAASYLEARHAIRSESLTVAVVGPRMQAWVQDLVPLATVRREGLRTRLREQWGQAVPPDLSASEIRALGLDTLVLPTGVDIETAVLTHTLGSQWAETTPHPSHLAELVLASPAEATTPYLARCLDARLDTWERDAGTLGVAYHALRRDPAGFRDAVLTGTAVRTLAPPDADALRQDSDAEYDEETLRRAVDAVLDSQHRDGALAAGRKRLRPILLRWWRGRLVQMTEPLAQAAQSISGATDAALEALADAAESAVSQFADRWFAPADLNALRSEFGGNLNNRALDRLAAFVMPEAPPDPAPAWQTATSLDAWRGWLAAYLPYRAALDRLGASSEAYRAVGEQATTFSDWFTSQYPALLHRGDDLVTNAYDAVRDRLDRGERVVWVIWDNLPAHHTDAAVAAFADAGLSLAADPDWRLALLPSVTAVSFPAILAGRQTARKEGRTHDARQALLDRTFSGHSVEFRNTLLDIEHIGTSPRDVHVIHFTSYDELLHRPETKLQDRRDVLLDRERTTIAMRLARAVAGFPSDRPVALIVTSDHGSTRLPHPVTDEIPLPEGAVPVEDYSSRAIRVAPGTPSSDDVCTRIEPEDTGLDGPILLARGLRSWTTSRAGSGYVHGGALPEEVLVPLLVLTPQLPDLAPLQLAVREPERFSVGDLGVLHVSLDNPNSDAARELRISVRVGDIERSAVVLDALPGEANRAEMVPFTVQPDDARDGTVDIEVVVTATLLGQSTDVRVLASVPVQSALRSQADDDIFDF